MKFTQALLASAACTATLVTANGPSDFCDGYYGLRVNGQEPSSLTNIDLSMGPVELIITGKRASQISFSTSNDKIYVSKCSDDLNTGGDSVAVLVAAKVDGVGVGSRPVVNIQFGLEGESNEKCEFQVPVTINNRVTPVRGSCYAWGDPHTVNLKNQKVEYMGRYNNDIIQMFKAGDLLVQGKVFHNGRLSTFKEMTVQYKNTVMHWSSPNFKHTRQTLKVTTLYGSEPENVCYKTRGNAVELDLPDGSFIKLVQIHSGYWGHYFNVYIQPSMKYKTKMERGVCGSWDGNNAGWNQNKYTGEPNAYPESFDLVGNSASNDDHRVNYLVCQPDQTIKFDHSNYCSAIGMTLLSSHNNVDIEQEESTKDDAPEDKFHSNSADDCNQLREFVGVQLAERDGLTTAQEITDTIDNCKSDFNNGDKSAVVSTADSFMDSIKIAAEQMDKENSQWYQFASNLDFSSCQWPIGGKPGLIDGTLGCVCNEHFGGDTCRQWVN
eukprot:Pgem_evm1s19257